METWCTASSGGRGGWLLGAAQGGGGAHGLSCRVRAEAHCRGVAGQHTHIDDGDCAAFDGGDRFGEYGVQFGYVMHGAEAGGALGPGEASQVNLRVGHALADPFVFDGTAALAGHAFLVDFVR